MANRDGANGLRPSRHLTGGVVRANEYSIASEYNTNIFTGDVVEMTGTGKNVAVAAGGNVDNVGVFAGCRYVNAQGEQKFSAYWPANTTATDIVALVYDDPNIVFSAQCDTLAEADVGLLTDWDDGAGSVVSGQSGRELAASLGATTGQALRILGLVPSPDNAYGAFAKVEVAFAEHVMKGVVAGVGGI